MNRHVTVVGGGIAGLSAALNLAEFGIGVEVVERSAFLGGHAAGFACKATDACVKCGACMVETLLDKAVQHQRIHLGTASRLEGVQTGDRKILEINREPQFIDPEACDGCGRCHEICSAGAILKGSSPHQVPFYALDLHVCTRNKGDDCTACSDACPHHAIHLNRTAAREEHKTDALVFATGFKPFDPHDKPYGYGVFANVVTNLDLEKRLRKTGRLVRPSDQKTPTRLAFIQCVGSRDAKQGHLWCSRVCCGSALRMAKMLKHRQPEIDITIFYIDIQSFGRDFESFYSQTRREIRFQRSIPGDIFENEDQTLNLSYVDDADHASTEEVYDMVVLSIGMLPNAATLPRGSDLETTAEGFLSSPCSGKPKASTGIFSTGSATGPMGIAESIASAGQTANAVISYLSKNKDR